jgi:regulatory protein
MIEKVLERLEEKGYTDDQKFAEAWVRSRQLTKKSSKRKLQQELQVKGVSSDIITSVLSDELIDETENLKTMIQKKTKTSSLSRYNEINAVSPTAGVYI